MAPRLVSPPGGAVLALGADGPDIVGRMPDDSHERFRLRRHAAAHTIERLCGVIAGQVRYPVLLDGAYASAGNAPRLATRPLRTRDLVGIRFLEPGAQARFVFEGIAVADRRHVSLQWPIVSDPSRPIPMGAPDSVLEASITPSAAVLDSVVASVRWPRTQDLPSAAGAGTGPREIPAPDEADAVPLISDLPVHLVTLDAPCLEATFAIPILARIDEVVRLSVRAGDRVFASAHVPDGTIRIAFDEAPRAGDEPRQRQSIPSAAIEAVADGRLTLRLRGQIVPRAQASDQVVYLRLRRTPR